MDGEEQFQQSLAAFAAGQLPQALQLIDAALASKPRSAGFHYTRGRLLRELGRTEEAKAAYRAALAHDPRYVPALVSLGILLREAGALDDAIGCYGTATGIEPSSFVAHLNLANALIERDRLEEAALAVNRALALNPQSAAAQNAAGLVSLRAGNVDTALGYFDQALARSPGFPEALYNRSIALLQLGQLGEGWAHLEAWYDTRTGGQERALTAPGAVQWQGESLAGRRILLIGNHGFGDTIQFVRYAPLVAARGADVLLEVPAELTRVMARVRGVKAVFARGDSLPEVDFFCGLMTLPRYFGVGSGSIPADVPYLSPDAESVERWMTRFAAGPPLARDPAMRVGLVWAGNPRHRNDRRRSLPAMALAPLMTLSGAAWYSLQVGDAASAHVASGLPMVPLGGMLTDFAETAAALMALDLVITVDTSVAHLAGALGRPVWILLPAVAEWRWLLERTDSPWYPSARLYRQKTAGDWDELLSRVAVDLEREILARRRPASGA